MVFTMYMFTGHQTGHAVLSLMMTMTNTAGEEKVDVREIMTQTSLAAQGVQEGEKAVMTPTQKAKFARSAESVTKRTRMTRMNTVGRKALAVIVGRLLRTGDRDHHADPNGEV